MIADGTLKTIEDEEDIYVSLTQLCEYFTQSTNLMVQEVKNLDEKEIPYARGMVDMIAAIANEFIEFGKFEAQRRLIDSPEDLLAMIDKAGGGIVE